MIYSMTGFGYHEFVSRGIKFLVTVKSVNSKYLDININLPNEYQAVEDQLIKIVKSMFSRGKLDIYIGMDKTTVMPKLILNENLLNEYIHILNKVKKKYKLSGEFQVSDVLGLNGVIILKQNKDGVELDKNFRTGFMTALKKLKDMREAEGVILMKTLLDLLNSISSSVNEVKKHVPIILETYKKRLTTKIDELLQNKRLDENRILTEVAILSDKIDINEEIQRLSSHLTQMKKTLNGKKPVGKIMEFMLQEMLREINTMGSKISQVNVTSLVINMKDAIEQLREQSRNIE